MKPREERGHRSRAAPLFLGNSPIRGRPLKPPFVAGRMPELVRHRGFLRERRCSDRCCAHVVLPRAESQEAWSVVMTADLSGQADWAAPDVRARAAPWQNDATFRRAVLGVSSGDLCFRRS